MLGAGTGVIFISLALAVFEIICVWKVFVKAGEPGWKSIIPIYNLFIFFNIAWEAKYLLYALLGVMVGVSISTAGYSGGYGGVSGMGAFLMVVSYALTVVVSVIAMINLAKRFGKSTLFGVGLFLFNFIFMAILAFDDSVYDRSLA